MNWIIIEFPRYSLVFRACDRAKMRDREADNQESGPSSINQPFKAIFERIAAIFRTRLRAYRMKRSTIHFSRIAIVSRVNTTSIHRISSASNIVEQTAPIVAQRVPKERIQQVFPLDPVARAARAVLDNPGKPRVPQRNSLNVLVYKTTFRI
jgi:hypothetical protein